MFVFTALSSTKFNAIFEKNVETKIVSFVINIGQDIQNGQILGTLSDEFRPKDFVEFYETNINAYNKTGRFAFKFLTDGTVKMDAIDVDTYCSWTTIEGKFITK